MVWSAEVCRGEAVVVWHVEFGRVEVMQVASRQSRLGLSRLVMSWFVRAVGFRHVIVRFGKARPGEAGSGSHVWARLGAAR